jgi:hypothetical protein
LQRGKKLSILIHMPENGNRPDIPQREIRNSHGDDLKINFEQIEAHANSTTPKKFELQPTPAQYDHTGVNFDSPEADKTLSGIRDRIAENPGQKASLYDLLWLVRDETTDIRNQRKAHEKEHPEWTKQIELVESADIFFDQRGQRDLEQIIISIDTTDGINRYYNGPQAGMETITFKK